MVNNCLKFSTLFLLIFVPPVFGQQQNLWSKVDEVKISNTKLTDGTHIRNYQTFQLQIDDFKNQLKLAPDHNLSLSESKTILQIPDESGNYISFKVKESPVMHPALAAKYPRNKSYEGVDENGVKIVFSINELGFYGMMITHDRKVQYIDPISHDKKYYRVYNRKDLNVNQLDFQCFSEEVKVLGKKSVAKINTVNDLKLRTYRLALAATAEYSEFHIDAAGASADEEPEKKAVVLAAMTVAITRLNSVFKNDLAIQFQLVSNNDELIYLDADSDPYDNDDGEAMLDQNQNNCNSVIGANNYDIGHVFSTGGGGIASLGSICVDDEKARGVTGSVSPTGDNFYFDFVAHEMGHQLGANHTFNGDEGNCSGDNRNDETAFEPGSGSTLMAYAGLCSPQNLQQHSDLYFHSKSIDEIWTNIVSGTNTCATEHNLTSNLNVPVSNAGDDFVIPISTPYRLIGQGSDADGDIITYAWEQMNNEINSIPPSETDSNGAIYRSQLPSTNNERYMPKLSTVMSGALSSKWEVTPSVARVMDFVLTVRDNNNEAGQIATDEVQITTTDLAGPFAVVSQSTADLIWDIGATENISWNVSGTTSNGVNTSHVNILLSVDGGKTFPIILQANTPNDGSQDITVPNQTGPSCRIMVEAVGNLFYAVNQVPFSIGEFTTDCSDFISEDIPKNIPDNDSQGVLSTISVNESNFLTDVKVSVDITHTWIADITLVLESPQGTLVKLISGECFGSGNENMNATFDDAASVLVCGETIPTISGVIKPVEELSAFFNENPTGEWKLKVIDEGVDDLGVLNNWSLELCTSTLLPVKDYSLNNFMLYPNPSEGVINISFKSENESIQVLLYDVLGRKIKEQKFINKIEYFNESFDFSDVASGVYILQVSNGSRFASKKIKLN